MGTAWTWHAVSESALNLTNCCHIGWLKYNCDVVILNVYPL